MGPTEAIIIILILIVLFGPALVAFFAGYTLGKKKSERPVTPVQTPGADDSGEEQTHE